MLRNTVNKLILLLFISFSSLCYGHGDGESSRIEIEANLISNTQAGLVTYQFELVDTKLRTVVTPTELSIVHEKTLHLFIFDAALKEFYHLHPEFVNGAWESAITLNRNGKYQVFSQGQLKADGEEFYTGSSFSVIGGTPANSLPPILGNNLSGVDDQSLVTLSGTAQAGKMAMLYLTFSRLDGQPPQIDNYLGAKAHIVATPSDGDLLLHVHPMDGNSDQQMMIHVTFPAKGDYRLWIQFKDHSELKIVPLALKIE